jgi:hypothetical protein
MSAITREQGDEFYYKIMDIRNEVAFKVKEKANQVEQVTRPFWEAGALINEAYDEFGYMVHQEFDSTIYEDLGRLFLSTSRLYFCSKMLEEVEQILKKKCLEALE